jgi:hypothetical protein
MYETPAYGPELPSSYLQEFPLNLDASFADVQVKILIRSICLHLEPYFRFLIAYGSCRLFYRSAASRPLFLSFLTVEHPGLFDALEGAP